MISEEKTTKTADPTISRDEAIGILNTPDDQLDELVARAGELREKYKGKHVGIHILTNARSGNCSQDCAYCAQSCPVQRQTSTNTAGLVMRSFTETMILWTNTSCPDIV